MYASLLGPEWVRLPESIRYIHRSPGTYVYQGKCEVRRGNSLLARIFAFAASLPPAGTSGLAVTIESAGLNEVWTRRFGAHRMRSRLRVQDGLLHESLGLAQLRFRLSVDRGSIRWMLEEAGAAGLKMPGRWFDLDVFEYDDGGRYHFSVTVRLRGIGLLVHYSGWLA